MVRKNFWICLPATIQEPLSRGFQNTLYFSQNDNFSTFGVNPMFGNVQNIYLYGNSFYSIFEVLEILELWTATKCAKIITLTIVRYVLKPSFQWLLNCVKQKNPTGLNDSIASA